MKVPSKDIIRSKYYIDPQNPDRFVTTKLYVQWREDDSFSIIPSRCGLKQGESPCSGNPLKPCVGLYSKCNAHDKNVSQDEAGRLMFVAKQQADFGEGDGVFPPPNVTVEWAKFEVETYAARSYIQSMARRMDNTTLQMVWDAFRYDYLSLQVLLKEWSLGGYDPELVLQPVRQSDLPFTMLSPQQMKRISRVSNNLVQGFLNEYRHTTRNV